MQQNKKIILSNNASQHKLMGFWHLAHVIIQLNKSTFNNNHVNPIFKNHKTLKFENYLAFTVL